MAKPVIGVTGGIGSGKSFVAGLLGELGCAVISSDALNHDVLDQPATRNAVRQLLGDAVLNDAGAVDRAKVAERIFAPGAEGLRRELEQITHPRIAALRAERIAAAQADPAVAGIVIDSPLLFEAGLDGQCDVVVFVDAPRELRLARVQASRGWTDEQLAAREKQQWPLDRKRASSQYTVVNASTPQACRDQVQAAFSRIMQLG